MIETYCRINSWSRYDSDEITVTTINTPSRCRDKTRDPRWPYLYMVVSLSDHVKNRFIFLDLFEMRTRFCAFFNLNRKFGTFSLFDNI